MKIFKKITAVLIAAVMVLALFPVSVIPIRAQAAEDGSLKLWYDEPASQGTNILSAGANYSDSDGSNRWQQQTLPIGSGDMGANVYGEIVSEHLTFNEKTLWTGGPSSSRPDYLGGNVQSNGQNGQVMQEIQALFLAGNTYEQSLVWQLYEDVIIAAETLGRDEELVAQWKANQASLKGPIEVGEDGQLKEWYEETTIDSMNSQGADAAGHRHLSHMLHRSNPL